MITINYTQIESMGVLGSDNYKKKSSTFIICKKQPNPLGYVYLSPFCTHVQAEKPRQIRERVY